MSSEYVVQNIKQLAQTRPSTTNATAAVVKARKRKIVVMNITVANQTAASAAFSLYLDKDGTTYDATTALFYAVPIAGNSSYVIEYIDGLPFSTESAGNLAVQSSVANAITFTINGVEG